MQRFAAFTLNTAQRNMVPRPLAPNLNPPHPQAPQLAGSRVQQPYATPLAASLLHALRGLGSEDRAVLMPRTARDSLAQSPSPVGLTPGSAVASMGSAGPPSAIRASAVRDIAFSLASFGVPPMSPLGRVHRESLPGREAAAAGALHGSQLAPEEAEEAQAYDDEDDFATRLSVCSTAAAAAAAAVDAAVQALSPRPDPGLPQEARMREASSSMGGWPADVQVGHCWALMTACARSPFPKR